MCSAGVPATAIDQTVTIAPTKASTLNFTFQQFDPSIGNLSCVTLHDVISGSSVTGARNTGPDSTGFLFQLTLTNKVAGPGISISHVFNTTYGYDTLAPYGDPADTISYGPENIITDPNGMASTGGNAAYLGLGTVNFTYNINGGMITLDGGSNYRSSVTTTIGGTLNLTYYWCPATPLGSTISSFSVFKNNGVISLQWLATNDQNGIVYTIEYSKNGENWSDLATVPAGSAPVGAAADYQYQYRPTSHDIGEFYFRIRRTDAAGNISYSIVKMINLQQADQQPGMHIYPNPVKGRVNIQFDEAQTGRFALELISTTGQVVQTQQVQIAGSRLAGLDLPAQPARGIYFLRARDLNGDRQFVSRVVVD